MEKLKYIFDNAKVGIAICNAVDNRLEMVNPAFAHIHGYEPHELIGVSPGEVFAPECMLRLEAHESVPSCAINDVTFETTHYKKDGSPVAVSVHITVLKDETGTVKQRIANIQDISDRKKAESELTVTNERYTQIFDNSIDPIYLLEVTPDKRFIHLEINPAYLNVSGMDKEMIVGRYVDELEDRTIRETLMKKFQACLDAGTKIDYISEFDLPTGHKIFHSALTPMRDEKGRIDRIIGIARDITERRLIEKQIEFMAHHDALTGLPNRTFANAKMEKAISYAKKTDTKAALLFIDLDGFKTINDSMGHTVGDAVLKLVASRLKKTIRASDTISRQGGDEFLLILSDIEEITDVITIAEKLLHEFEQSFSVEDQLLSLSASIGISIYPEQGETFEALLQNADTAMYKAKESGKNTYRFFTRQMNHNIIGQFKIQNDLKTALQNNEFVLFYQPQIELSSNTITGSEALIRWKHPQLGMIPPMNFIPIAESSGLIVQIGQWVIEEACRQASIWHKNGIKITVAVNISAVQFKRGDLESIVNNALQVSGLNPTCLELELTESIMMHNVESTLQTVQALKALGVQLSIDDFGTGYSSLAYLKRFDVDKLKIDQSFLRDLLRDREDATIVKTIIQMAKNLNLKTIAEGVEDAHVLAAVNAYGCDEVQGYHFAKPMEAHDFEKYHDNFYNAIMI